MNEGFLKLTVYFGERDRAGGRFLSERLSELHALHRIRTSILLRGAEGFGLGHQLRTDRLLTLSEDLPLVSAAVDLQPRVEALLRDVAQLPLRGLITVERVRAPLSPDDALQLPPEFAGAARLTIHLGRHQRAAGGPAHEAVVARLRHCGVAGATVLLGVDGTVDGARRRASLMSRNAEVPAMVIAVGEVEPMARVLPELEAMLERPLVTLERVRICKRDGVRLAEPPRLPDDDPAGLGLWQKLTIHASEQSRHAGRPLYRALLGALREAGAAGATTMRGIWGYHGDHAPHGDSFWQLRRRVPVVTVVIDRPAAIRRWFEVVDELTDEAGLVTVETVPAALAMGAVPRGGLRLARPPA